MTTGTLPIAPPFRGQSAQVPIAVLKSPYCEKMLNFKTKPGKVELRKGSSLFSSVSAASGHTVVGLFSWESVSSPVLILITYDPTANKLNYFSINSAGTATFRSLQSATGETTSPVQGSYFRNNLFFFGDIALAPTNGPTVFNGTWVNPMPVASYTWPTSFFPLYGAVHKNRHYIINRNTKEYGYSDINSIAGSVTRIDLSDVVTSECELFLIRSIGLNETTSQQNVAAFIFSNGDILIYEGSYPDSQSWGLASRFKISDLFYSTTFCDAKGDTFLFTNSEILSLRNLFVNGYESERQQGIGAPIQPRWIQIVAAYLSGGIDYRRYVKGLYDTSRDRMVIVLPVWVDPTTGIVDVNSCGFLIYDFQMQAWYEYKHTFASSLPGGLIVSATYYKGDVYYVADTGQIPVIFKLEGSSGLMDAGTDVPSETIAINYDLVLAPTDIPKFGTNAVTGVEVICKSDLYEQTNVSIVADLGRAETSGQVLPPQGTGINKPLYNVGINDATFSQIRLSGSTVSGKTVGLELYAMNVWYETGQKGAR